MQKEYSNLSDLRKILAEVKPTSIFLVTGKNSYESSGAKAKLHSTLNTYNITQFNDFEINPKIEDVKEGVKLMKSNNCDLVIAVGGGSVMDIAKSINTFAAHEGDFESYIRKEKNLDNEGKPYVAIPTTSGTGSESTHFAVLYINNKKYSVADPKLMPKYVILDSTLTTNLPPRITAITGMDALGQAIESFWSINSTEESKKYSKEAIKLLVNNLESAVNKPNLQIRKKVMLAANLAGKAINIAKTTASHAVSYPITSNFGVPHGHAVALTLGEMLEYNYNIKENECNDSRGIDYVKKTINELINHLNSDNADSAKNKINSIIDNIGLERNLSLLGIITDKDFQTIIDEGFNPDRVRNNPRLLTEDNLRGILNKIE